MDVVGIGLFFGASIIVGTIRDGYFDWLLPAREQPAVDPPVVTVVHHTVTVTRRIVRTTPSSVTVSESIPTYITRAADPYHKIWSLSWTDLLQCFGPFFMVLLFVLLMFWWLGHDDTAHTAPVEGADSPSPPSSPNPSGANSSKDTKHENPDLSGQTALRESSNESSSSTKSTRVGTGFFRRPESAQASQRGLYRSGRRPIRQARRIPRETAAAGQGVSAGPAVGQSTSGSGTGIALRDAITFGRASRFTAEASDDVQDIGAESNNGGASRSGDSEVPDLFRSNTLEPPSNAAPDPLPPYVPPRRPDPNDFNRPQIVDPDVPRIIITGNGAQPGHLSGQAFSSAPPSSRPSLSDRNPAHQHTHSTANSADPTTPAVDAAHPHPISPHRSILTPLSNSTQQALPHSEGVGSTLCPISEGASVQDSHRQVSNSLPAAAPEDDSDLIEFPGSEPEQEDNLPGDSIAGFNAIQQHNREAGHPGDDVFRDDRAPGLVDAASDGTFELSDGFGGAPQGATRPESRECSEAESSIAEDNEDFDSEDVLGNCSSSQVLGHGDWTNSPERSPDQIEDLSITVPNEQQIADDEDPDHAVGSASEEALGREDGSESEQSTDHATQSQRTVPSRSPSQTTGPGLATPVISPTRATNIGAPSSQPTSPVTPQRSIASDEHDELYSLTPERAERLKKRGLEISRSLAETLSGFAGSAGASDLNATEEEKTNDQEQGARAAILPANSSEPAVIGPSVAEQVVPTETRPQPLYVDFMGQTGTLRTSATSSEAPPSSLPADVWSSQPFPAARPASAFMNNTDREQETYPLRSRLVAQAQISMQGHTPPRVEDFSSPSTLALQDSFSAYAHGHRENQHVLTLPHPAREEVFEPELPSVRDVDNNPHFWAPGERSQARRLRELPSRDTRRLPIHESALDHSTPPRDETTAIQDFGTPSSPEDGLVRPLSTALADPFTEASSEPSAPREARDSIAFSVPPLGNRAGNDETGAENGQNVLAQEVSSHQQGLATSRPAAAEPTTPAARTLAGISVTPNTASSASTQIITTPHSGKDCQNWVRGNYCADYQCRFAHDERKLNRDRNGNVICSYFMQSRCSRGNTCRYSHDMDNRNGNTTQQPTSTAPVVPTQALQAPHTAAGSRNPNDNGDQSAAAQNIAPHLQTASAHPEQATASNNNGSGITVPRNPETATSRVQRDPEELTVQRLMANMASGASHSMWADGDTGEPHDAPVVNHETQVRPSKGPPRQVDQPQQSAETDGSANNQPNVRPPEDSNINQDANAPKGKEKQTDASLNNDSSISTATSMPGQESIWSDTNYIALSRPKGRKKQQQQQQKKNITSETSTTVPAAAPSVLPQASTLPPAQPQAVAGNQSSARTQAPTAAQASANLPASEQDQVPESSRVPGNTRAPTHPQSSSNEIAASIPHVNDIDPPEMGPSETPNSSWIPEDSSHPDSAEVDYRRVNTALVPDYTESNSAQSVVQSLGQKPQASKIQDSVKDPMPFRWADEFDDSETFTPGTEIKQAEQAPHHQTPTSAQDTPGNPPRQPAPTKPEEKSQAICSVQTPSEAEQKLMNQIGRLEKKNSNDQAIMLQCLSSGNVSKAKQLKEQDIPYNEAGLLQLRANLERINPGNPLLQQNGAQDVGTHAADVQDDKPTQASTDFVRATDAPDDDALQSAPPQPVATKNTAEQQSENAAAQASNVVEDQLSTGGISSSMWANLPDVDLSKRARRKKVASTNDAGPSNKNSKGDGNNKSKGNGNGKPKGSGDNDSKGSGTNSSNGNGNGNGKKK
ncbi:hypothetical protein AC578_2881 [Pseudocercospora eumusae]|uniref:C3H1-type domain-containing protein n=1 Tax=Pseudocercospora eumusae TaxID=321146 RepID=A0A139GY50_9PEZI|nr:hypothetical protein AC578_2881 [Pseudocercospora eumusae]